jgi:hypothetical protein
MAADRRGAIPRAAGVKVETPGRNSSTDIVVSDVRFDGGLADELFTQRRLEQGAP